MNVTDECPSRSATVRASTPPATSVVPWKCRRSWILVGGRPSRLRRGVWSRVHSPFWPAAHLGMSPLERPAERHTVLPSDFCQLPQFLRTVYWVKLPPRGNTQSDVAVVDLAWVDLA
jgi:hypothetical protein